MGNSENSVRSKAPTVDVLIIGAGPAGLGVALGLCRQMHTAILFDSGVYRNAPAKEMHNVPTWDNKSGEEYRGTARMEVMGQYNTVQFVETTITQALQKEDGGGFFVRDSEHREWEGRKLVLATGVRDVFPDIDGYGDCWGRGIFHCLFCHGYEDRGAPSAGVLAIGQVANSQFAKHFAATALQFSSNVTIYTNGSEELTQQLTTEKTLTPRIKVDGRSIRRLSKLPHDTGVQMDFESGESKLESFLAHKPATEQTSPFAEQLHLELDSGGDIKTRQPFFETNTPGIFAVGDCATPFKSAGYSAAMGGFTAAGLAQQLQSGSLMW